MLAAYCAFHVRCPDSEKCCKVNSHAEVCVYTATAIIVKVIINLPISCGCMHALAGAHYCCECSPSHSYKFSAAFLSQGTPLKMVGGLHIAPPPPQVYAR